METKANYVIVGAFTVVLFLAGMAFAWWLRSGATGPDAVELDVIIEGSVTGLEISSPVKFNGINVGKVTALRFDPQNPNIVIARTTVPNTLPITPSTRAVLGFTGLTGIAHVEFEGGNLEEQTVFQLAEEAGQAVPTVRADPSAINDIIATAQDVFKRVDSVMGEVELFFGEAREPLTRTLENTERFSASLAENSQQIDQFLEGVGSLGETLAEVSTDIEQVLQTVDGLARAINPDEVGDIVSNIETFTGTLEGLSNDVSALVETADARIAEFEGTGARVNSTLDQLDDVLSAVPADSVATAVDNIAEASQAARDAANDVAGFTDTLEARQADIDRTITNVAEMAERLNAASVRVDGVLAKLDGFLGEGDAGDLLSDASETLASFRQVADTLNSRLDGITSGLERFSGRGLRDVEALVSETRRSISRIESAISAIERDPQRLLFGGEGDVKRFDGRQRR